MQRPRDRPAPPDAEPPAPSDLHRPDDRFVPVRLEDLVTALESDAAHDGTPVRAVAAALRQVILQEVAAWQRSLECQYARVNPDRDTLPPLQPGGGDPAELRRQLQRLADKANFARLDPDQVAAAISAANSQGLHIRVRPELVEHLELYARGRATVPRRFRSWRRPFRGQWRELEVFRRMLVVAQLRGDPHVHLKLFREIPSADLEALLPHAEVLMTRLDRLLIVGGGAGAMGGLATKLFWFAIGGAVVASQLLWPAIIALGMLSVKSALGYRRARIYRNSLRTRHLYERNLANNAAVVEALLGSICQEELKEALLAWAILARRGAAAASGEALARQVEQWLAQRFEVTADFDATDALESLDRLDLWADRAAWRVVEPGEAVRRLEDHWQAQRTAGYYLSPAP